MDAGGLLRWVDRTGLEKVISDPRALPFPTLTAARSLRVWPLQGGLNHGVFGVEADGRLLCLKLYADSGREQAAREWWALQKLWPRGLAPEPLGYASDSDALPHGAVLMALVPGKALATMAIDSAALASVLGASAAVHATTLGSADPPWIAGGHPVHGLRSWLEEAVEEHARAPRPTTGALEESDLRLLDRLIEEARQLSERSLPPVPALVLCRGDPSLANVLVRPGGQLCLVDWEYCGRGDPAYELADYVHHPTAEGIPHEAWVAALHTYPPAMADPGFAERFALYDLLVEVRWCLRLARHLRQVLAGVERRPEKSSAAFVSATRRTLAIRLRQAADRLELASDGYS